MATLPALTSQLLGFSPKQDPERGGIEGLFQRLESVLHNPSYGFLMG